MTHGDIDSQVGVEIKKKYGIYRLNKQATSSLRG